MKLYLNLRALTFQILMQGGTFIFILYLPGNRRLYIYIYIHACRDVHPEFWSVLTSHIQFVV